MSSGAIKKLAVVAALLSLLMFGGCAQKQAVSSVGAPSETAASSSAASLSKAKNATSFFISINGTQLKVELADTDAARALVERLQAGPVTVSLHAYGGFEKVGPLPWSLPASDEQLTAQPGDVMLYQGNQMTVFTGSNSWAYTAIGHIQGATSESLTKALGDGDVEAVLSL